MNEKTGHMQRNLALESDIATRLRQFDPVAEPGAQGRAAAVAVAITDSGFGANLDGLPAFDHWSETAALILTRRAAGLRRHAGQWALPGGRIDGAESAEQAALRELSEEIGLQLDPGQIVGRLDTIETRSGYVMTPVVVLAGSAREIEPNADEVASIHRIPVTELLRDDAPMLEQTTDSPYPDLRMPVGDTWIAAPTAAVLYQFREVCLLGRATRVAHFGQPRFTWK